jgi:hypothetical protein
MSKKLSANSHALKNSRSTSYEESPSEVRQHHFHSISTLSDLFASLSLSASFFSTARTGKCIAACASAKSICSELESELGSSYLAFNPPALTVVHPNQGIELPTINQ